MRGPAEANAQARAALESLRGLLGQALLGLYLHGSAIAGGLKPQSDLDFVAVIAHPLAPEDRKRLLSDLLAISAGYPAPPGGPRCIELMVFTHADIAPPAFPARAEFLYGEWLREAFETGQLPLPLADAENTLVLAQARQAALPLLGPEAKVLLPEVPLAQVRRAMREALPALLQGFQGDERNVLLTLARMWRTAATGDFVAKDAAARWAASRLPDEEAATLTLACEAYLGRAEDDWDERRTAAQRTAATLREEVTRLLEAGPPGA